MCEAPGAKSDGFEIKPGPFPGTLSILVQLKETPTDKIGTRVRAERGVVAPKRLTRLVPVGWDADVTRARGSLDSGLLTISVPRRAPSERSLE